MNLTSDQVDRAAGVLLGCAVGDALGVPYEFTGDMEVSAPGFIPEMRGGGLGPYDPGEWSDDTQMTMCIAQALADGADPLVDDGLDQVTHRFLAWKRAGASDIGSQTRLVLEVTEIEVQRNPSRSAAAIMTRAASLVHQETGKSAGNGSLMRTAPVALRYLDNPEKMTAAAVRVSRLTHFDMLAADACVIWCHAIREAVLNGPDGRVLTGITEVPPERRYFWRQKLDDATGNLPARFSPNGYVVTALQAAWAAITVVPDPVLSPEGTFRDRITRAVTAGNDTDTVAAIAGALLGGICGVSAIPAEWQKAVHGWPDGSDASTLVKLGSSLTAMD